MCEVQGPGGRYRLGEVVHGQNPLKVGVEAEGKEEESPKGGEKGGGEEDVSELESGEYVELDVESEMKDAGLNVLIVSVAWETMEGRRTFQRFMKFNVGSSLPLRLKEASQLRRTDAGDCTIIDQNPYSTPNLAQYPVEPYQEGTSSSRNTHSKHFCRWSTFRQSAT